MNDPQQTILDILAKWDAPTPESQETYCIGDDVDELDTFLEAAEQLARGEVFERVVDLGLDGAAPLAIKVRVDGDGVDFTAYRDGEQVGQSGEIYAGWFDRVEGM